MVTSTPERVSATPPRDPPAAPPKSRTRKPSAKVLEAQQSLRTRTITRRLAQNEEHTVAGRATQQTARPTTQTAAPQATEHGLPPFPTEARPSLPERGGGDDGSNELGRLIAGLTETIAQQSRIITSQSSIIESIRKELADIKSEQQRVQNQYTELQEVVFSLRAQLDILSASPPSTRSPQTQSWASVASSGGAEGSRTTSSRTTSGGNANNEYRQLVIDVSRVGEQTAEKVATTDAAKQIIEQGMRNGERLTGATIKDFRVWRANDKANVIKFSVEKDQEAAFRQTTAEWLEPHIPGARLVGPKWHPVKVDWIEVPLAMDVESGKVSKSAMERFGTENGVEVCTMRWLGRPRPSGQHASVVVKVATKEEAEKLLKSDGVTFGGGGTIVSRFEERRTPVACFKCRRFGHRARDCMRPETCDMCGQEGHLQCETTNLRCVNCQREHRASDRKCPAFWKEKERILAIRQHT